MFDVYRGAQVGEGSASLALRLEFRAPDRTLTDEEADKRRAKIVAALASSSGRSCVPDVAVLGASGYAGAIAATLLYRHPYFELNHVTARSESGAMLDAIHPRTRVPLLLEDYDPAVQGEADAALVCWPHGVVPPAVAALRERGVRVVDLSADFRLRDRAVYDHWYGRHAAPELFGEAVYGLPELYREAIAGADLVANPGCYPTAALLALAPLARAGVIGDVVIDAKSGVSGAGREPSRTTHFIAADENMTPYKVEGHRHTPEIEQELAVLGAALPVTFTPHLVPLAQGELVSCYVTPAKHAERRRARRPLPRGLRGRALGRGRARAARGARGPRHQLLPHLACTSTAAPGA